MTNEQKIKNILLVNEYDEYYDKVTIYQNCNLIVPITLDDNTVIKPIVEFTKKVMRKDTAYQLGYYSQSDQLVFYREHEMSKLQVLTFEEVDESTFEELRIFSLKSESNVAGTGLEVVLRFLVVGLLLISVFFLFDASGDTVIYGVIGVFVSLFLFAEITILNYVSKIYLALKRHKK